MVSLRFTTEWLRGIETASIVKIRFHVVNEVVMVCAQISFQLFRVKRAYPANRIPELLGQFPGYVCAWETFDYYAFHTFKNVKFMFSVVSMIKTPILSQWIYSYGELHFVVISCNGSCIGYRSEVGRTLPPIESMSHRDRAQCIRSLPRLENHLLMKVQGDRRPLTVSTIYPSVILPLQQQCLIYLREIFIRR